MTNTPPALRLHLGETHHRRFTPFKSSFRYRVAMIDVDIDRLEEANRQTRLFSVEKLGLFGFRRNDHGSLQQTALRPWAETTFSDAGIEPPKGAIRLVTFPRHAFYKFAPISLWIAHTPEGHPEAILYEVRNTFGERHTYAASLQGNWSRHEAPKRFHVSPFFDVTGRYSFSLRYDADALRLGVTTIQNGRPVHSAGLATSVAPASDRSLAALAMSMPFSTIGVTLGIHWEAAKLWAMGARYHKKPLKVPNDPTLARTSGQEN